MRSNYDPYGDMIYGPTLRKIFTNNKKSVRHQETCPTCGRKLVNIYQRNRVWQCKKCWDSTEG